MTYHSAPNKPCPLLGKSRNTYYPKWMERHGSEIVSAFKRGDTIMDISRKQGTAPGYVVALLKSRDAYSPREQRPNVIAKQSEKASKRPLIKHPSEIDAHRLHVADDPPPEPPKLRKCIGGCGKHFLSEGPGNRICAPCGDRVGYAFNGEYSLGVG